MKKFDFAINSIFFVLSFFFFIRLFSYSNIKYALYFVPSAIVVYFLKAFRLRLLLAGEKIVLNKYIQVFCKTTIASVLLPFKIGEIFKIYSFARLTKNATKGTTIILLDRFVDTAALLCIFAVFNLFENTENFVFYLLFRHSANAVTEMERKRNRGSLSSCPALASEISDFVSES